MAKDPEYRAHLEWLGYLQPVGLVVSPPALLAGQAHINKNIVSEHTRFLDWIEEVPVANGEGPVLAITDLPGMLENVFEWEARDLVGHNGAGPLPAELELVLPEYNETLRPTYAVEEFERKGEDANRWQLLIHVVDTGLHLDEVAEKDERRWQASPQSRFERLLREKEIPIGLLSNGTQLRLVYAPRGETSGHVTFPVQAMSEVSGRPIFAALHLLLSADRMFTLPSDQRLPAILRASRKYQNEVSTKLSGQVLNALYELLRGFQAADDQLHGELLREVLDEDPNHVYKGLLNVLMRLVFTLYAEDRGLLSNDPIYVNHYSVTGLFGRLREDANRYPDTMDQRFGAWAQLLALFRLIHDGAEHGGFRLQRRRGHLFDPDRFNFLEGRPYRQAHAPGERIHPPMVSDGIVFRALQNLLVLEGERLSYRTLDVEQIGSVYETMMGFNLEVAEGRSIAIKPAKAHGAPTSINLDELLEQSPGNRAKWIQDNAEQKITGEALKLLKDASTPDEAVAALAKKISPSTPRIIPPGAMLLQPSDERRRSGSHYTPRSLTEPIVRTTLKPILKQLGETPTPDQILDLKICDPAMGSGAFLVEACRQLGDELIKAWYAHDAVPTDIPPDEDEVLYARRLVAQRCLYGVDKNDMAVDLAKLSLWLVTLARDHPFTFLDHSLRHGDSLVGLTRRQIIGFHWEPNKQKQFGEDLIQKRLDQATEARAKILNAREDVPYRNQEQRLAVADEALIVVRVTGDACVSAFFSGSKKKEREDRCEELRASVSDWYASGHDINRSGPIAETVAELRQGEHPIPPFHWEIEFPEVFSRENAGFDGFVGNPPFAGVLSLSQSTHVNYTDYLRSRFPKSGGKADLVAFFFRRVFELTRKYGTAGLVATNTIGQGDTRESGLSFICDSGGVIYNVRKRLRWPGTANVIVSTVCLRKSADVSLKRIDNKCVNMITAYLFHAGGNHDPAKLSSCPAVSSKGVVPYGMGFVFQDGKSDTSPVSRYYALIAAYPCNSQVIGRFIGGEDFNQHPTQEPERFIINFGEMDEAEARKWPTVMAVVEEKVKPTRMALTNQSGAKALKKRWWQFAYHAKELSNAKSKLSCVLATAQTSRFRMFAFSDSRNVFDQQVVVFANEGWSFFCVMQSTPHILWSDFFGSTMKDDPRYFPSDCFETFPFPLRFDQSEVLASAGKAYYTFRLDAMRTVGEGLTKTYNHFHDPHEKSSEIAHLRELHEAMDRAVLEAYGWDDLAAGARCEFLLDYEEEDDETESGRKSKKKKPWRLRWPDDFHDEVLARLLELNEQRAEEEKSNNVAAGQKSKRGGGNRRKKVANTGQGNLILE